MRHFISSILLLSFSLTTTSIWAQTQSIEAKVRTTFAEKVGYIESVAALAKKPSTAKAKRAGIKKPKKAPRNFVGRGLQPVLRPELDSNQPDQLAQRAPLSAELQMDLNFDGITSGSSPNDPSGDVSPNHYVQAVNVTQIAVYEKDGDLISTFSGNSLWQPLGFTSAGDPIILYDQLADRWLITEFPDPNELLVAVSETSDPLGAYNVYNFSTPSFPDYPKYAVWDNVYTVTTNEAGPGTLEAYVLDKQALINGDVTVPIQRIELPGNNNSEAGFLVATPVDLSGLQPAGVSPMFMRLNDATWGDSPEDAIEIYTVTPDFTNPSNTIVENQRLFVSEYDSNPCSINTGGLFPCIPQPGGTVDGIPEVIMNQVHYRKFAAHEAMVLNFITDVDGNNLSGIRWIELRRTIGEQDWTVYQEGTFTQPDGLDRYMGSSAIDASGNIAMAYCVSSETEFIGLRLTGRNANDPLGQMTVEEFVLVDGQSTNNSFTRFGDYAHMTIDPADGTTFWYTSEYAGANNRVNTRIAAFKLQQFNLDLAATQLEAPTTGSGLTDAEQVQIRIQNAGLTDVTSFSVGYRVNGGAAVTETVNQALAVGEGYTHTFASTEDLTSFGDYNFEYFVSLTGDESMVNDTSRQLVRHIAALDLSTTITNSRALYCGTDGTITVRIANEGTAVVGSFEVSVSVNGTPSTYVRNTTLQSGEVTDLDLPISDLIDGDNDITTSIISVNGMTDQLTANDESVQVVTADLDGQLFVLELLLDEYPDETAWVLSDDAGNQVASSTSYTEESQLIREEFCLDSTLCYTFTITDAANDGICCGFGQGNFSILAPNGVAIISNDGNFGGSATEQFCASETCVLSATTSVTPTTSAGIDDGAILVNAVNGVMPFTYSINNGATSQAEPLFNNLAPGTYTITVTDASGSCSTTVTAEVIACAMSISIDVTNPSSGNDGSITVTTSQANGDVTYSIDGGATTNTTGVFENLAAGAYTVVVIDSAGCTLSEQVSLETSSIKEFTQGIRVTVAPNPTKGVFSVEVTGLSSVSDRVLPLTVFDATGQRVYQSELSKYDEVYTGPLSLYAYPSGVYFLRLEHQQLSSLIRVIKQ